MQGTNSQLRRSHPDQEGTKRPLTWNILGPFWNKNELEKSKGRLGLTIFKPAETVHLILLCCLGDAIRCAVSVDLKMVARKRSLEKSIWTHSRPETCDDGSSLVLPSEHKRKCHFVVYFGSLRATGLTISASVIFFAYALGLLKLFHTWRKYKTMHEKWRF